MYITNPTDEQIKKWYGCIKIVADYLIYNWKLSLLARKGIYYYFANTEDLKIALDKMPLGLKILAKI